MVGKRRRFRFRIAILKICASVALLPPWLFVPASAQETAAPAPASAHPSSTVVTGVTITAPRYSGASVPDPVLRAFVRSRSVPAQIGQLARWRREVCPRTVGLPQKFDDYIDKRIKEVAAKVGAPTKLSGSCLMNIVIVFTPEPQRLLDDVRNNNAPVFGFHYPAQLRRITTFKHAIQAWYTTATRGDHGQVGVNMSHGGVWLDDPRSSMPSGLLGSRLSTGLASEFAGVLIVADWNKVSDRSIGSVADYIALLALSDTPVTDACGEMPSITDLLASACNADPAPDALTSADLAYLNALYATNLKDVMSEEQNEIVDRMQQRMTGKSPDRAGAQ